MGFIGWLGSLLLAFCGLPELIRTIKHGKCYIGGGMLISWLAGEVLVFIYVLPSFDMPLLANYMSNICILVIMCYYKIKK